MKRESMKRVMLVKEKDLPADIESEEKKFGFFLNDLNQPQRKQLK